MHFDAGSEQRTEEAEPLEMVEVQVRQQDVNLVDRVAIDCDAECAYPGSGVENERGAAIQPDFDAGRVAAVAERLGTGSRQRTATTPHPRLHHGSSGGVRTSQKTVSTPCMSSTAPKSG